MEITDIVYMLSTEQSIKYFAEISPLAHIND